MISQDDMKFHTSVNLNQFVQIEISEISEESWKSLKESLDN
jgi:hypothetical protein